MHLLAGGVYACVCAEWGAHSNSNSPIPSLSLQGKLLTQEDIYVTRRLFAFPSFTKARYFGKGKVQGSPASTIKRVTARLICQHAVRENVLLHLAKGKSQCETSYTEPSITLTDVLLEENWGCPKLAKQSEEFVQLLAYPKCLFGRSKLNKLAGNIKPFISMSER